MKNTILNRIECNDDEVFGGSNSKGQEGTPFRQSSVGAKLATTHWLPLTDPLVVKYLKEDKKEKKRIQLEKESKRLERKETKMKKTQVARQEIQEWTKPTGIVQQNRAKNPTKVTLNCWLEWASQSNTNCEINTQDFESAILLGQQTGKDNVTLFRNSVKSIALKFLRVGKTKNFYEKPK
jgi:hypothetical protein